MKIAVFFHDCIVESGATQSMYTLIESWHSLGVEIIAFVPGKGSLLEKLCEIGIKCYNIPGANTRYNLGRSRVRQWIVRVYSLVSLKKQKHYVRTKVIALLKKEKVDIMYANTTASVIGYFAKQYSNIPLVWHVREFGDLDQNVAFVGGKKKLFKMLGTSDLLVFISKAIEDYYREAAKNCKSIVAYNDLSSKYDIYRNKSFDNRPLNILSCGALNPGKGHLDVIKAISLLRKKGYNVELYIAGKGDLYLPLYISLIDKLKLDNCVHMLGQVKDISSIRKKCEVGVVASKMEAFGRVTVEGMLSGMVMIGANSGGTAELIEHGETGLLFEVGDVCELANCIEKVINNPLSAAEIAYKGYRFSKKFIEGNCAKIIYQELKGLVSE